MTRILERQLDLFAPAASPKKLGRPRHRLRGAEEINKINELLKSGVTIKRIAAWLKISPPTFLAHYAEYLTPQTFEAVRARRPLGRRGDRVYPGRRAYCPTEETRRRIAALRADGLTIPHVASAVGVSETTIRKYFLAEVGGRRPRQARQLAAGEDPLPLLALPLLPAVLVEAPV